MGDACYLYVLGSRLEKGWEVIYANGERSSTYIDTRGLRQDLQVHAVQRLKPMNHHVHVGQRSKLMNHHAEPPRRYPAPSWRYLHHGLSS